MVISGILIDLLFSVLGLIPSGPREPSAVPESSVSWNYTSWLDLIALVIFATLLFLHFRKARAAS